MVIIAINSNLVLSLGMVGALSIVRFRTPIKDPTDLILPILGSRCRYRFGCRLLYARCYWLCHCWSRAILLVKGGSVEQPYLLVVNCDNETTEKEIHGRLNKLVKRYTM